MNWLVYHIASGQSFFTGTALMIVSAFVSSRKTAIARRISTWTFLVGVIAVVVSSTAIPYWYYGVASAVTCAWLMSAYVKRLRHWSPMAVALAWAIAAAIEIPYHITPHLVASGSRSIAIIGDSVTAGVGDRTETWPGILAREHNLDVQDASEMGETAATALRSAKVRAINAQIVLIEIGGNDLLGSTSSAKFDHDLDAILAQVSAPGRQVVMFELPLPPFCHEYGRVQRSLAKKHKVLLIPKRVFLSVLAGNDSTLDTIHLSQLGHQRMAAAVWQLVGGAIGP